MHLLGEVHDGKMHLSKAGLICHEVLASRTDMDDGCALDDFVVMPNHVHILITIDGSASVSAVVRTLKAQMTLALKDVLCRERIWQPSFHDHIVRNEKDLARLREYIQNNPQKWDMDRMNREGAKPLREG